ncbi:hypothetical protein [Nocardia cyriacigeorgica]|uniref:hypothetical protein n=1 Tax=Nocardia cyriacigeorgica TaxID=135487 RepID=UPI0018946F4A|nr:hypothetical protein [Nocardia cyriacigeorgica]MBF6416961.1 hypothetical protein [Nocardia cyriacigeorgica]
MSDTARRLSGDEYMALLQQRMDEWLAIHSTTVRPKFPPLLEWFIQDGDENLVDPAILAAPEPQPKPVRRPRYYRPASYWQTEVARLEAERATLTEPLITDRAAAGGVALGPKRTARIQQREDGRLRRYVALEPKLRHAQAMLRAAAAREAGNPN